MTAARLAGVGAFVIGGLALFAVGIFMIGDRQMAFVDRFTVYTEFSRITGLQPGALVRVSGARAGSVRAIEPPSGPSGRFRVRLEVAEHLHQLVRTDSVAAIETEGLVGGSFLAISTGSEAAPEASPESTLPSQEPFAIADLLQQMSDTIVKVNSTIDRVSGDVEGAIASISTTVNNANALLVDLSTDITVMAKSGARISSDIAVVTEDIRQGRGTIGRLMMDDELYARAAGIAKSAEEIAADTREVVRLARQTFERLDSPDGAVGGIATDLRKTLDETRAAMAGFADNMEALKRNFLFRGFFNNRGYFNLSQISPAEYRQGALTANGARRPLRIWLGDAVLFEQAGGKEGERWRLSEDGKLRLASGLAEFLDRIGEGILVVEGYAADGTRDEQYLASRAKADAARAYLVDRFGLDLESTGLMPLGADSQGSPGGGRWNGIALALFVEPARRR
jgi:phospholipid/cholesterol/gamma-HCH transport system substrate-binding protein